MTRQDLHHLHCEVDSVHQKVFPIRKPFRDVATEFFQGQTTFMMFEQQCQSTAGILTHNDYCPVTIMTYLWIIYIVTCIISNIKNCTPQESSNHLLFCD